MAGRRHYTKVVMPLQPPVINDRMPQIVKTKIIREEISVLAAAQERLRKLNLQVRQEVETAILDVDSSSERVKATEKAIEQARESLRIETLKYNLGAGTITDILDAQTALLLTETTYYRALADFRTALARLKLAVGGNLS